MAMIYVVASSTVLYGLCRIMTFYINFANKQLYRPVVEDKRILGCCLVLRVCRLLASLACSSSQHLFAWHGEEVSQALDWDVCLCLSLWIVSLCCVFVLLLVFGFMLTIHTRSIFHVATT